VSGCLGKAWAWTERDWLVLGSVVWIVKGWLQIPSFPWRDTGEDEANRTERALTPPRSTQTQPHGPVLTSTATAEIRETPAKRKKDSMRTSCSYGKLLLPVLSMPDPATGRYGLIVRMLTGALCCTSASLGQSLHFPASDNYNLMLKRNANITPGSTASFVVGES
jgi:hypothetical protein